MRINILTFMIFDGFNKFIVFHRNLKAIQDREICCYSISCKEKENIDITLQWLIAHSKSNTSH